MRAKPIFSYSIDLVLCLCFNEHIEEVSKENTRAINKQLENFRFCPCPSHLLQKLLVSILTMDSPSQLNNDLLPWWLIHDLFILLSLYINVYFRSSGLDNNYTMFPKFGRIGKMKI